MSHRDTILKAIAAHLPPPRPDVVLSFDDLPRPDDLMGSFISFVKAVGGEVQLMPGPEVLGNFLEAARAGGKSIINRVGQAGAVDPVDPDPAVLAGVEMALIRGSLAVAENGAIWVDESAMGERLLPFACQQLVLVIDRQDLVANMHEAYRRIQINRQGFGVFIAGPSKTADIEQSLVIGAHGPKALTVIILG